MIQIACHAQEGAWTVDENYDAFVERFFAARVENEPLEVELADGMYGTLGTKMRMTVEPHSIAWYRDLDGVRRA